MVDQLEFKWDDREVSEDVRIARVLYIASKQSTVSTQTVQHALATSGMETRFIWMLGDITKGRYSPNCPRTMIGLEGASGVRTAAWIDPEIRKWLVANNLVTVVNPANTSSMLWADKVVKPMPPNPVIFAMFEDTLKYQFAKMVPHFSIGPTQRYLMYAGKAIGGEGMSTGACLPRTWEELHARYVQFYREGLILDAACQYPTLPASNSDSDRIAWLKKYQTGYSTGVAEGYYYGTGSWANSGGGWRAKMAKVQQVTAAPPSIL